MVVRLVKYDILSCSEKNQEKCLVEIGEKLTQLESVKWKAVACELEGEDPFQYLRAYSPGTVSSFLTG